MAPRKASHVAPLVIESGRLLDGPLTPRGRSGSVDTVSSTSTTSSGGRGSSSASPKRTWKATLALLRSSFMDDDDEPDFGCCDAMALSRAAKSAGSASPSPSSSPSFLVYPATPKSSVSSSFTRTPPTSPRVHDAASAAAKVGGSPATGSPKRRSSPKLSKSAQGFWSSLGKSEPLPDMPTPRRANSVPNIHLGSPTVSESSFTSSGSDDVPPPLPPKSGLPRPVVPPRATSLPFNVLRLQDVLSPVEEEEDDVCDFTSEDERTIGELSARCKYTGPAMISAPIPVRAPSCGDDDLFCNPRTSPKPPSQVLPYTLPPPTRSPPLSMELSTLPYLEDGPSLSPTFDYFNFKTVGLGSRGTCHSRTATERTIMALGQALELP